MYSHIFFIYSVQYLKRITTVIRCIITVTCTCICRSSFDNELLYILIDIHVEPCNNEV